MATNDVQSESDTLAPDEALLAPSANVSATPLAGAPLPDAAPRGVSRRVAGATFNYGLGQILPKAIDYLLIPVYLAYLTPYEMGLADLACTLAISIVILMRCGVPGAVSRYYYEHREGPEMRDYVTTVARFINVSSLVVGALTIALTPIFIERLMPGLTLWPIVVMVVIMSIFSGNSDVQKRLIQAREQSAYSAVLSIVFSIVDIALTLLLVVGLVMGAVGLILAQTIVAGLFFIQAYYYLWPDLKGRFRPEMLRSSLKYGLSILPSHILSSIGPLILRVILAGVNSLAAVGQLALATRLTSPLDMMLGAFSLAYNPVYFSVRKHGAGHGETQLATTTRHVWLGAVTGCLAVALLGPPLVLLLVRADYHPAAPLLPILALNFVVHTVYILLAAENFYSKRVWLVSISSAAGLGSMLLAAMLLTPSLGAAGVAWAQVTGTAVATTVAGWFALQTVRIPHDWWGLSRTAALALLAYVVVAVMPQEPAWQRAIFGAAGLVGFGLLLLAVGDATLKELAAAMRRILLRSAN